MVDIQGGPEWTIGWEVGEPAFSYSSGSNQGWTHTSLSLCRSRSGDPIRASSSDPHSGGSGDTCLFTVSS